VARVFEVRDEIWEIGYTPCWPAEMNGGVTAYKTNLTPLVTGPVIELPKRHAKIRSSP